MTRKDKHYIGLLGVLTFSLVCFLTSSHIFGNQVDWYSQHVVIADSLRHAIRQEGTIFPTYLKQLMGGVNIYHFSYYGYLRPDILIGALFPHINMSYIIIFYSVFLMILTVIACYLFLRKHSQNENICLFVSLLMMLSTIVFHSHKQLMFVNYMPFLFLALISLEKKHFPSFIIWGSLIVIHSYFYCIGCFIICLIYLLHRHPQEWKKLIFSYLIIVMITAILTMPTLGVILNNGKSGSTFSFSSLFFLSLNFKGLLYSEYGCGLTYIAYILLVFALNDPKLRKLSGFCLFSFFSPIVWLIMNGFLYARSKILIVFMPLVAYIMCMMLMKWKESEIRITKLSLILIIFPLFFMKHPAYALVDCLFSLLMILEKKKILLYAYLVIPFIVVCQINSPSSFYHPHPMQKEITQLVKRNQIQTLAQTVTRQNVNQTYGNTIQRISGYTSTNHRSLNRFLFETLKIPIPVNNQIAQNDTDSLFYLKFFGIDTLITKRKGPVGYILKDQNKKLKLYQAPGSIAYATSDTYSEKEFCHLTYPYTLDTLMNRVIVKKGQTDYQSQFREEQPGFKKSYHITRAAKKEITLKRQSKNEIVVLECDVINKRPEQAVSVRVNGIKNKLASIKNPYYQPHTHFTYVLSTNPHKIKVHFSKGDYEIKNIKMHTLPATALNHHVDTFKQEKTSAVLSGNISVTKSGYFVTHIPYEKGYRIEIDHQLVKIERVNQAFLGCRISKGKHKIKITFIPPGYQQAKAISLIGVLFLIVFYIYERKLYKWIK